MKLVLITLIYLIVFPVQAQNIPNNAWSSGSNWYCNDGYKKQDNGCVKLSAQEHAKLNYQIAKQRNSLSDGTIAYISKIDSDNGDIIKLENGGIVEISSYFGYLGYRKNVVLYGKGSVCNLWIEGKKSYKCSLIKSPNSKGEQAKLVHISEVKGNGSILKMLDGSIFEVIVTI